MLKYQYSQLAGLWPTKAHAVTLEGLVQGNPTGLPQWSSSSRGSLRHPEMAHVP